MNTDRLGEARSVAARSGEPFMAWMDLKRWSLGKGPAATRAAVISFMEAHGNRPEAAALIPEISRIAQQMPEPERKELLQLTNRTFSVSAGFSSRFAPVPRSIGTPLPKKDAREVSAPPDIARMMEQRDAIFHVSRGPSAFPKPPEEKRAVTRGSFAPALGNRGHAIVNSLADLLSTHGHEGHPVHEPEMPVRGMSAPFAGPRKKARRTARGSRRAASRPAIMRTKKAGRTTKPKTGTRKPARARRRK